MADRYWVGGTGNWSDDDNHWATSSGGSPANGNLPTASDSVIFDTNSSAADAAYTMTIDTSAVCDDFTMDGPGAGNNITWAGSSALAISGSMNLIGGSTDITRTYTGAITFNSTATTETITTNGLTTSSSVTFSGSGGKWTNQDNWNNGSGGITITQGEWDSNGKTITTTGNFTVTQNALTKVATWGASSLSFNAFSATGTSSNFTLNAGTSTMTISNSGNAISSSSYNLTFHNVVLTHPSTSSFSFPTIAGSHTFNDLTITGNGTTTGTGGIKLSANQTVNGTFTCNGLSATTRKRVYSNDGAQYTITAATVSISNVDFCGIVGAGAGTWSGTSVADGGNNSGITFTTAVTRYWVGGTGSWSSTSEWSDSSGGAGGFSVPLIHDTVVFDANSFTAGSLTLTIDRDTPTLDFTNVTNNPTINATIRQRHIFGSFILKSGMTNSTAVALEIRGGGAYTITSAGLSLTSAVTGFVPDVNIMTVGGSVTLSDAFSMTGQLGVTLGTFDANDQSVTIGLFTEGGTQPRVITMGSGTWTITGTGTVWATSNATNLTLNAETSTIKLTDTSATAKTFSSVGPLTYNNFWNATTGTGTVTIGGGGTNRIITFNDFKIDAGRTMIFTASRETVVSSFTAVGTGVSGIVIQSSSTTNFTLTKTSGIVTCDYLTISDSTATGGAVWFAGANSTDAGGGNTGWRFMAASAIKTFDGLAYASTSKLQGTALGYAKTWNGLA